MRSTRERILVTAIELIGEEGFKGFSVNRILRRGGFSKGSFYVHFEGLEDLCLACYDILRVWAQPQLHAGRHATLRDFLLDFGAQTLGADQGQMRRHFSVLFFFAEMAMTYPVFLAAQRELTRGFQQALVGGMRQFVAADVDDTLLRDLAAYLLIVLDGIGSHRLMFEDPGRMARVWPLAVESVERALRG